MNDNKNKFNNDENFAELLKSLKMIKKEQF